MESEIDFYFRQPCIFVIILCSGVFNFRKVGGTKVETDLVNGSLGIINHLRRSISHILCKP